MNIEEEEKAKKFYIESDIEGIHTQKTNTVELNYLDLLKLMHNYSLRQGQSLPIDSVSQRSEQLKTVDKLHELSNDLTRLISEL